jgi:ferredoxin-NADP reductase
MTLPLVIREVTYEADEVLSLRLADPHGEALAPWEPGAHCDVLLPSGLIRQYSLCGDPEDRSTYRLAVLVEPDGRGGSLELQKTAQVGRQIPIRGPRNHFPLVDAEQYLFIAGGIGITPILPMIRWVTRRGRPWRLYYGGRSLSSMAFRRELAQLGADSVTFWPQDHQGLLDVESIVAAAEPEAAVYCCGPEGLLRAVERCCAVRQPPRAVHLERFAAAPASPAEPGPATAAGREFEVELKRTGRVLRVPAGRSVLDVVRDVLPDVPSSCEEGYCGTCETAVIGGVPEHHDDILTPEEQARGTTMMICVGRAKSPRLILDL